MVDEVTTWLLGNCWGKFEILRIRRIDISRIRGPVGFLKLGVLLYLGEGFVKKLSFQLRGEKRALDVFSLGSVEGGGRRGYSCSVKFWVKRSTSVLKSG